MMICNDIVLSSTLTLTNLVILRRATVAFCLCSHGDFHAEGIPDYLKTPCVLSIARERSKEAAAVAEEAEWTPCWNQTRREGHTLSSSRVCSATEGTVKSQYSTERGGCTNY